MGRIKTTLIKRTTKKLLATHNDRFSPNFKDNKASVGELAKTSSKKLRNVIAGYATRLSKRAQQQE